MKSIKFTEEELEHLRESYQMELAVAQQEIERIREILGKLRTKRAAVPENILALEPVVRGLKPVEKVAVAVTGNKKKGTKTQEVLAEMISKQRKQRSDKGKPRKTSGPAVNAAPETVLALVESLTEKPVIKSKSPKKKRPGKYRGITLVPLSKPLPKRTLPVELPQAELPGGNPE